MNSYCFIALLSVFAVCAWIAWRQECDWDDTKKALRKEGGGNG